MPVIFSIVELQFIAGEIDTVPAICTALRANTPRFQTFFNSINNRPNLILVDASVNRAKGSLVTPRNQNFASGKNKNMVCHVI